MNRLLLLVALFFPLSIFAQSYTEFVKPLTKKSGFFTLYTDETKGNVYLEINHFDKEFLYVNFLATGIGSNDIGLDRGQIGNSRIVFFKRIGPKVLLIQPNLEFRAISDNQDEVKSVKEAFAQSVLGGFQIEVENKNSVLINITDFLLQDVHGVAKQLKQSGQGSYSLDKNRSSIWFDVIKSFPDNTEMEALLTVAGKPEGAQIESVVPSPESVSFRVRHSFVRLPDSQFETVEAQPESGFFGISYQDYATPIELPLVKRFIQKHRIVKKNPDSEMSEAIEPIIYYVDSGAPEPIRSALIEGASWWNQAFEAAGFTNAFQVKVLPENVDPLDIRYNVIQWVHRSTRGWSYGMTISDPRTGEIIKGHVSLGSLRVRQDYLIATALLSPFTDDFNWDENPMKQMALARLRQLAAHEVGHTLGLAHNYSSSMDNKSSVMDYPHPSVTISNKSISLENAYSVGIGEWDKQAIRFGYGDWGNPEKNKENRLKVIKESREKNLTYISDYDARAMGGAHPNAHLWDNGTNAADELLRLLTIRKTALSAFSEKAITMNSPMSTLQEVFVPLYYFHRYQTEATIKLIGGKNYRYASRGEENSLVVPVPAAVQRKALYALFETLNPEHLQINEQTLGILNPRTPDYYDRRELFKGRTLPTFDPIAAAEAHIQQTAELLFHPARIERTVQQNIIHQDLPGVEEIIEKNLRQVWLNHFPSDYEQELNYLASRILLEEALKTTYSGEISLIAQKAMKNSLNNLKADFSKMIGSKKTSDNQNDILQEAVSMIDNASRNPNSLPKRKPESMPPGSPIGTDCTFYHN